MDQLPDLCIDKIVSFIAKDLPRHRLSSQMANIALVGNEVFTDISRILCEVIDPGCTEWTYKAHEKTMKEHQEFCNNIDTYIASLDPVPSITEGLTHDSKVVDLKNECRRLGVPVSAPNKAQLWTRIQTVIEDKDHERKQEIKRIYERAKNPPVISKCFVRPQAREEITKLKSQLITATRAKKEYVLTESDLDKLPCTLANNPHYKCAAPMRLYKLVDIMDLANAKHASLEDARSRRQSIALKAAVTRQQNTEALYQRVNETLDTWGVNQDALRIYSRRATIFLDNLSSRNEHAVLSELRECWQRLVHLRSALAQKGLALRQDSRLCSSFIDYNNGDLDEIVSTMEEMNFYFEHTNYERLREEAFDRIVRREKYYKGIHTDASEDGKEKALREWTKQCGGIQVALERQELPISLKNRLRPLTP